MFKNFDDDKLLLKNIFNLFDFDNDTDISFFMKLSLLYKTCNIILLDLNKEEL